MVEAPPHLESQVRVSKMLGVGFALSLYPSAGVGSLIALLIGIRALRIIRHSEGEVAGRGLAWWCIAVGALGLATVAPYVAWLVVEAVNK